MFKFLKTTSVLLIIFLFISNFAYATDIDMNITDENSVTSTYNNVNANTATNSTTNTNRINTNNISDSMGSTIDQSTIIRSVTESSTSDGLGLSNILNILLIVVGVVLILLAIAILIRLHG